MKKKITLLLIILITVFCSLKTLDFTAVAADGEDIKTVSAPSPRP